MVNVETDRKGEAATEDSAPDPISSEEIPARGGQRPVDGWDIAGLLLFAFVMLAAVYAIPFVVNEWFYESPMIPWLTGCAGLATATAIGLAARRERVPAPAVPAKLLQVWREPPGDWVAFALGAGLALPLVGLYASTLFPDSDSMRIVATIRHVQRGNLDFLVETQDSFGPHLILGPLLKLFGPAPLRIVGLFSLQLLAGLLAWIARRLSGSLTAGVLTVMAAAALPAMMERTLVLPMYTTMLIFGVLASWLAYRAVAQDAGWWYAAGAGLCLALAQETQLVGQLFLSVPLLVLILAPDRRRGLVNLAKTYGATVVFFLPRLIVNLSDGGLRHIQSNRTDFWITEGYLRDIQMNHLGYAGLGEPRPTYLVRYPWRFIESLGDFGWVALGLAVVAVMGLRGRARWFALSCLGLVVAAMTFKTIQPTSRYFAPLWPGIALLAGLTSAKLLWHRRVVGRVVGAVATIAVVAAGLATFRTTALRADELTHHVETAEYLQAADIIDDGKGVIGGRSHRLLLVNPDIPTYGGQFLTEEEYVTYLLWPSDQEVIDVLERHDIGWVMTRGADEANYQNAWLVPHHGDEARYLDRVEASPDFCRVFQSGAAVLYRYWPGGC